MSDNKKPAAKITFHPVSAAIWRNENNGQAYYSATYERRYKDEGGKWHTSGSFNASDSLLLAKVADAVHSKIEELRRNDRQAQPDDEAA